MTTTTTTILTPAPATLPVPWRRLAWVAWRRYRTTLIATVATLGVVAIYLFITGYQIHSDYNAWHSCAPRNSAACNLQLSNFLHKYGVSGLTGFIRVLAPGLVGAFAGAPLLARELETGTFRYAWTQGAGRMRWTLATLTPGIIGTVAISAAFGALISWYDQPLIATGIANRMGGTLFPAVPPAAIGWALMGFSLGVLAGLLWRRVLPALATTIVGWFGLALLTSVGLRKHYLPPLVTSQLQINNAELTVSPWWTKGGHPVGMNQLNQVLQAAGLQGFDSNANSTTQASPGSAAVDPVHYLTQHGYTLWTSYQPTSRYATFEWIEFGWLTVLALLLLGVTVFLLRRRQA